MLEDSNDTESDDSGASLSSMVVRARLVFSSDILQTINKHNNNNNNLELVFCLLFFVSLL